MLEMAFTGGLPVADQRIPIDSMIGISAHSKPATGGAALVDPSDRWKLAAKLQKAANKLP